MIPNVRFPQTFVIQVPILANVELISFVQPLQLCATRAPANNVQMILIAHQKSHTVMQMFASLALLTLIAVIPQILVILMFANVALTQFVYHQMSTVNQEYPAWNALLLHNAQETLTLVLLMFANVVHLRNVLVQTHIVKVITVSNVIWIHNVEQKLLIVPEINANNALVMFIVLEIQINV